jgi:hypothetical protein
VACSLNVVKDMDGFIRQRVSGIQNRSLECAGRRRGGERERKGKETREDERGDERIGKSDNGKLITADLTRSPSEVEEEQEQRGCWIMMNRADACTQQEAGGKEKETDTRERGKDEGSQPACPVEWTKPYGL